MASSEDRAEQDWIALAARGNEQAFHHLYRRHAARVHRFAAEMAGSTALADEVTQEVFLALIAQLGRFDPAKGPLAAYLLGIARHITIRLLRRERLYVEMEDGECPAQTSGAGATERAEDVAQLRQAIRSLPSAYREVILLCELEEMDYAEAARVLECPIGTVRSRLHRARTLLMERFQAKKAGAQL